MAKVSASSCVERKVGRYSCVHVVMAVALRDFLRKIRSVNQDQPASESTSRESHMRVSSAVEER